MLLTVELGGHTAYGSDKCASAAIDDYLVELTLPEQGTVCGG